MPQPIAILGAGGLGREVLTIFRDQDRERTGPSRTVGFIADRPPPRNLMEQLGVEYWGVPEDLVGRDVGVVIAIGSGAVRQQLADRVSAASLCVASAIHPSALVGDDVNIGEGLILAARSHITTNVEGGRCVVVDRASQVGHDCWLGDFVTLSPGSILSGGVVVESDATVFTAACVLPSRRIGRGAVVGAGAVVVSDVPAGVTVVGVPAKEVT